MSASISAASGSPHPSPVSTGVSGRRAGVWGGVSWGGSSETAGAAAMSTAAASAAAAA
eukprot:CAMPEP_0181334906 /NCGR_PEP_ID=MMETSP1101-20121128/26534_1 /TAXON_ID=46948 /ORGANISM="Rhodomonas abbreviata, Strain Caron Lab Isolate" /LENGTH=57 /DNA_ID=CAMNT_0023444963 /DNA_START=193 /DNA_END=362 /DNA_ORIENTATION=+